MIEYQIVWAGDRDSLQVAVRDEIEDGWEPLGGVSVASHFEKWENSRKGYTESESVYTFVQAMIKRS